MTTQTLTAPITTEQLLAMPNDGMDRWLIQGELREQPMTVRNRLHSLITGMVSFFLIAWQRQLPRNQSGRVVVGEAGFRFPGDPETTVGIDVAYVSHETMLRQASAISTLIEGVPVLAVEILSPSDTQRDVHEKIGVYLAAGVQAVWIIEPDYKTVTIFEPGKSPVMYNQEQELSAEAYLPGFAVQVRDVFA